MPTQPTFADIMTSVSQQKPFGILQKLAEMQYVLNKDALEKKIISDNIETLRAKESALKAKYDLDTTQQRVKRLGEEISNIGENAYYTEQDIISQMEIMPQLASDYSKMMEYNKELTGVYGGILPIMAMTGGEQGKQAVEYLNRTLQQNIAQQEKVADAPFKELDFATTQFDLRNNIYKFLTEIKDRTEKEGVLSRLTTITSSADPKVRNAIAYMTGALSYPHGSEEAKQANTIFTEWINEQKNNEPKGEGYEVRREWWDKATQLLTGKYDKYQRPVSEAGISVGHARQEEIMKIESEVRYRSKLIRSVEQSLGNSGEIINKVLSRANSLIDNDGRIDMDALKQSVPELTTFSIRDEEIQEYVRAKVGIPGSTSGGYERNESYQKLLERYKLWNPSGYQQGIKGGYFHDYSPTGKGIGSGTYQFMDVGNNRVVSTADAYNYYLKEFEKTGGEFKKLNPKDKEKYVLAMLVSESKRQGKTFIGIQGRDDLNKILEEMFNKPLGNKNNPSNKKNPFEISDRIR